MKKRIALKILNRPNCEDVYSLHQINTAENKIENQEHSFNRKYWNGIASSCHNMCACGSSFKEFLTKLDIYYTAGKFGTDDWFDLDSTLSSMRNNIKEAVNNKELSKSESKELLQEVESLEQCSSIHEYRDMIYHDCDKLYSFFDAADFPCKKDVSPSFKRFWNEAWAVFINQIKEELK